MELIKAAKLQIVKDEPRVSPDGIPYRATEWRHESGEPVFVNADEFGFHVRARGQTAVNLDAPGLVQFIRQTFEGR
jgi:hypothetical protein